MLPIERHERALLQFSGGKDSLACLYLLKPYWSKLDVYWLNTGAMYPEALEEMRALESHLRMVEVKSDQPAQIERNGPPADVVSVRATTFGAAATGGSMANVQSFLNCCYENIHAPLAKATAASGIGLVIRGQKNADKDKGPIRSGAVVDGIEYWFPIEDWTDAEVFAYLKSQNVPLPAHYEYVNSSLDCWSCTAYRDHVVGRMRYMREHHPELAERLKPMLQRIQRNVREELEFVEEALYG